MLSLSMPGSIRSRAQFTHAPLSARVIVLSFFEVVCAIPRSCIRNASMGKLEYPAAEIGSMYHLV